MTRAKALSQPDLRQSPPPRSEPVTSGQPGERRRGRPVPGALSSEASLAASHGLSAAQRCRDRRGGRARISRPGDGPANHEEVGARAERLLRGSDPSLVIRRGASRPHSWRDQHDVVADLGPYRRYLMR
jgi:hypothetical protein